MPLKQLKKYISAYDLPAKGAIEKDDLVKIIINTRPISNASEVYYRTHRASFPPVQERQQQQQTQQQPEEETSSSSAFSNFINDIFGGSGQNNNNSQRRQEEQSRRQQRQRQQQHQQQEQQRQQQQEYFRQQQQQQQEAYRQQYVRQQQQQEAEERRRQQEQSARQQQQPQYKPSPPSVRKDDMLSLDDMIRSKIDPNSLSVRTLKSILKANFVEQSHVLEKCDLVSRVERLATQRKKELADKEGGNTTTSDDSLCRVCLDAEQNCVFLDCGHMVTCMDCAKQVIKKGRGNEKRKVLVFF